MSEDRTSSLLKKIEGILPNIENFAPCIKKGTINRACGPNADILYASNVLHDVSLKIGNTGTCNLIIQWFRHNKMILEETVFAPPGGAKPPNSAIFDVAGVTSITVICSGGGSLCTAEFVLQRKKSSKFQSDCHVIY
jgi:hypothetical protein